MGILSDLDLHPCLRARIHRVYPPSRNGSNGARPSDTHDGDGSGSDGDGFVLYLPTVCLRHEQNPSFAVACHAANRLGVPLVVLAVVVDDASHARPAEPHRFPPVSESKNESSSLSPSVVMTSRRLAFTLQALSHACKRWSAHGAAVGIRIHAPNDNENNNNKIIKNSPHPKVMGARTPDHLTLASRASLVVTDEPFVSPFTTLVHRVEEACKRASVECVRVDGSCTVPPVQVLTKRATIATGKVKYDGVPSKAWQWQKKTEHMRNNHLEAAMGGCFDAPELLVKMEDEDLCVSIVQQKDGSSLGQRLAHLFPPRWKAKQCISLDDDDDDDDDDGGGVEQSSIILPSAPDVRPFTSEELSHLYQNDSGILWGDMSQTNNPKGTRDNSDTKTTPLHNFALNWPGADPTVPPCPQTIGTTANGMHRWNNFVQNGGLARYGKERNDPRKVLAPSRMSAYLNLGIVSIFQLVWEVKCAQKQHQSKAKSSGNGQQVKTNSRWDKSGPDKFEEEIVKFREQSYAHAFSRDDYDDVGSLPSWSVTCLNDHPNNSRHAIEQMAIGTTGDPKWDAMQQYLVKTGELHNNVRMTWGKTVVEWAGCSHHSSAINDNMPCSSPAHLTLRTLCYLNDRYALDGLSPPSYAGLLWCMGWSDKPSSGAGWRITKKPASRYKRNAEDFRLAAQKLLASRSTTQCGNESSGGGSTGGVMKRQRSVLDMMKMPASDVSLSTAPTGVGKVEKNVVDKTKPKSPATVSKRGSASVGMKREGSFMIDSFFSKKTKKTATEESMRVVG